ncbi:MAG: ATP-binding protein [Bacteroidota bacterium]
MIIEFTVGNFLSFKEQKTLSLEATHITEYPEAVFNTADNRLLKSAVLYGANASGKSNLIKALLKMKDIVLHSASQSSITKNNITPFLLDETAEDAPSYFEIIFLTENIQYRYGFEIDETQVHSEWLFKLDKKEEVPLFARELDGIGITDEFSEGNGLEEKTRANALFLAVVDQFNGKIASQVMAWFNRINTLSGLNTEEYDALQYFLIEENEENRLSNFFKDLDLGFEKLSTSMTPQKENVYLIELKTAHRKLNSKGEWEQVEFDLREQESAGTNKIVDLAAPIFKMLDNGGILLIDELDAKLHPLLTTAITNLFNSTKYNPKNAQLIFATHDTNLLTYGRFRRDQIYFLEKDKFGASDLYSLVEYKEDGQKVRKDRSFEKDYIAGRYGAIPFIGNFKELEQNGTKDQD